MEDASLTPKAKASFSIFQTSVKLNHINLASIARDPSERIVRAPSLRPLLLVWVYLTARDKEFRLLIAELPLHRDLQCEGQDSKLDW